MKPPNAIIADDERELAHYLKTRLEALWPELDIMGIAGDGLQALSLIEREKPDIAFLDIKMPGLSGMAVAEKVMGACRVVFITAYDQYAVDAFDREAIDYLLKPVTVDRLKKTVDKLKRRILAGERPHYDIARLSEKLLENMPLSKPPSFLQWIRAQKGDEVLLIPVEEITYIRAEDKYTTVFAGKREFVIRKTVKELAAELDPEQFWQIHRGTIVRAAAVSSVSRSVTGRGSLRLKDRKEVLSVSRRFAHLFKQM